MTTRQCSTRDPAKASIAARANLATAAAACVLAVLVVASGGASRADSVYVASYGDLVAATTNVPPEGRTITVKQGTYTQSGVLWITGQANLTIQGETSDPNDTVLTGQGMYSGTSMNIGLNNCPHFTILNMTLTSVLYHAVQFNNGSHYGIVRNCVLWDNGESGIKSTYSYPNRANYQYSDYGLIENCRIGNTTVAGGTSGVVEGIDLIAAKGWVIRNNTFINIILSGGYGQAVFGKGNSQDTVIESNYFYQCDIGPGFGGGGTGLDYFRDNDTTYEHRNGIIRNNVIVGGKDAAVYLNKALNAKVYNNLAYATPLTFQARFAQMSAELPQQHRRQLQRLLRCPLARLRRGPGLQQQRLGSRCLVRRPGCLRQRRLPPARNRYRRSRPGIRPAGRCADGQGRRGPAAGQRLGPGPV